MKLESEPSALPSAYANIILRTLQKVGEFVVQRLEQGVLKHRAISLLFTLERNNGVKEKEKWQQKE